MIIETHCLDGMVKIRFDDEDDLQAHLANLTKMAEHNKAHTDQETPHLLYVLLHQFHPAKRGNGAGLYQAVVTGTDVKTSPDGDAGLL